MSQYKAISPTVEVNGETVLAFIAGMDMLREKGVKILVKHGIVSPQAGSWYPQQAWLDAFKEIAETVGSNALFNIGAKIPESAQFPPGIDSLGKALPAIDVAYHMNHRNGDIGSYGFERSGERSVVMVCDNPYPCDFDRGIISAFCGLFLPKGCDHKARVAHDDAKPCRKTGAKSCTYVVTW